MAMPTSKKRRLGASDGTPGIACLSTWHVYCVLASGVEREPDMFEAQRKKDARKVRFTAEAMQKEYPFGKKAEVCQELQDVVAWIASRTKEQVAVGTQVVHVACVLRCCR